MESCPCECRSMNPGATTRPRTLTVSRAAGAVLADETTAIRPSLIPTCLTASRPVSGSRTRPPTRTTSRRAERCAAAGADAPATAASTQKTVILSEAKDLLNGSRSFGRCAPSGRLRTCVRERVQKVDIEFLDIREAGNLGTGRRLDDYVLVRCVGARPMPGPTRDEWQLQPLGEDVVRRASSNPRGNTRNQAVLVVDADGRLDERRTHRRLCRRIPAQLSNLDVAEAFRVEMSADEPDRLVRRLIGHEARVELCRRDVREDGLHPRPRVPAPHPVDVERRAEQIADE